MPDNHGGRPGRTITVAAILAAFALGAYFWLTHRNNPTLSRQKLTIAQAGDFFLYAPLYIAIDANLFADQSLDVSLVSTGGDDKTWAAVISGSADFGVADPTFVAISGARGQPGRVVGTIVNGVPFWGITLDGSLRGKPLRDILQSKTVATFPSPSTAYTLQKRMFLDYGLDPRIREGAFGTLRAMLQARQADVALELEPNVSQAVAEGATIVYSMAEAYPDFAITGLTTTPSLPNINPELVRGTLCAIQQSLEYIRTKPDQALSLLNKRFPEINVSVAKAAMERVTQANIIPQTLVTHDKAWSNAIALREAAGDITTPGPANEYIDNTWADWASSNCGLSN